MGRLVSSAVLLVCAGVACLLLFRFTPARIDADGFLHEPFYLIPIGIGLVVVGAVILLVNAICLVGASKSGTR